MARYRLRPALAASIRNRRAVSVFSPSDISGMLLWLDSSVGLYTDDAKTIPAVNDGDDIGAWADRSGNTHDATQATAGNKPHLKVNIVNGLPVVRFTRANSHWLSCGTALGRPTSYSLFVVFAVTNIGVDQYVCGSQRSTGVTTSGFACVETGYGTPGTIIYGFGDDSNYSNGYHMLPRLVNNTFVELSHIYKAGNVMPRLWQNGAKMPSQPASVSATSCGGTPYPFAIGRLGDYNGSYLDGDVAEVIIYDGVLTDSQRRLVEAYLAARYGLTLANAAEADNAATALTTPTYDGSGQVVHPNVLYFPTGWNGKKYWMAMTPYPSSWSQYELASILCSDDGTTWAVPAGLTNPISPAFDGSHTGDPCLLHGQDDKLYCYHIWAAGGTDKIYVLSSSDGVMWSSPLEVLSSSTEAAFTPFVLWDGSQYVMWYNDYKAASPYQIRYRTSANPESGWSSASNCVITVPTDYCFNHLSIVKDGADYYMFLMCSTLIGGGHNRLWLYQSSDGITWTPNSAGCLLDVGDWPNWDNHWIYLASGVKVPGGFELWYSACTPAWTWHVGKTTVWL